MQMYGDSVDGLEKGREQDIEDYQLEAVLAFGEEHHSEGSPALRD